MARKVTVGSDKVTVGSDKVTVGSDKVTVGSLTYEILINIFSNRILIQAYEAVISHA